MSDRPRLQDVIASAIAAERRQIYTVVPAKIVKWDADKQRANCQILVKQSYRDEEDERKVASWPVVTGVPVQIDGSGGYRTTYPISDGNLVIDESRAPATTGGLFFSHVSLDKWMSGTGGEVDPELDHDHALTDAYFVPGWKPFGAPWGDVPTDHMTVGHDEGMQIHVYRSRSIIGSESAADAVVTKKDLQILLFAIQGAGVTPGDGGASLQAAIVATLSAAGWSSDISDGKFGSLKVKVER